MKTTTLLAALTAAALCSLSATAAVPAQSTATPRSLWVWNTSAIRAGGSAQAKFFSFLAAPKGAANHAIRTIYFDGVSAAQLADPSIAKGVRSFLKAAHARHLRVDFLTGDPNWATAAGQADGLRTLDGVLAFNKGGAPTERYDGFQYDVEPYSLPDWPSAGLRQSYIDLFDKSNAAIRASGQRLLLTAAIPRWFDQAQFDFLDEKVIDRTDEVLIMDYVQKSDRLVDDAMGELNYAAKVGKKVWIGVETGEVKDEPNCTFFALGNAKLEGVLDAALPRFAGSRAFAGYAVHHYESYVGLRP